jgi:hypothetical protein
MIPSPDGNNAIRITRATNPDGDHQVVVKAYSREYKTEIGSLVNAEVAWSPDSKAFFVTYSDGGNVGTYHVKVFYVTKSGLRIIEPVVSGRKLFAPTCFDPESPNVAAIKWTGLDSSRLLIALLVPNHSSCASMATFRAFEIMLPDGRVIDRFGQIAAKKLFQADLGPWLRDADDACIRRPADCVPPGLDEKLKRAAK